MMYTGKVVLKTEQETGESVGIIGKSGELGGNSEEIRGKLVNCVSTMGKQNSLMGKNWGK